MSTTDPTPRVAGDDVTEDKDTTPLPGVGEMPTPREWAVLLATFALTLFYVFDAGKSLIIWGMFFGFGLVLDLIDLGWRFHYQKVGADQILWWIQPHYVIAALLGCIIDMVYPINYSLSFVATIVLGVALSIPIEKYYLKLE